MSSFDEDLALIILGLDFSQLLVARNFQSCLIFSELDYEKLVLKLNIKPWSSYDSYTYPPIDISGIKEKINDHNKSTNCNEFHD
ncbi:hypothetical protein HYE05_00905 [Mycoplasmopsis bovis]|nr:hypothetical protein [Mycoplasmopsis bovis]QQH27501.1 hypothetical protein HYE05_00905 [Mycoplasmopsis bovis]